MHNLLGRVEQLGGKTDISLKAADRALRDVRAALASIPPLPSRADYEDVHTPPQGGAGPARAEGARAARGRRLAEVGQRHDPGTAVREDGSARTVSRIPRRLPARSASCSSSGAPRPTCRATRPTRSGAASRRRTTPCGRDAKRTSPPKRRRAPRTWRRRRRSASRPKRWPTRPPGFRPPRRSSSCRPSGRRSARCRAVARRRSGIAFATACDAFFTRRHDDLAQRKGVWAENLARKDALCVRAEALADSTDWDAAAAEIKQLQAEWKTIGPVKKSRSEAIWQRFRAACDRFFERYAQRHDAARAERVAAREAICAELEALGAANERRRARQPTCSRTVRNAAEIAGSRSSRRAASTPIARGRSTRASTPPSARSSRAGRRPSAAPTSIPTPTASAWKRSSRRSRISRRRSPVRPRRRRPTCRRRTGSPRC